MVIGLSYTSFDYSDLVVEKKGETVSLSLKVTNSGKIAGAEIVQIYVKDEESSLKRPEKELKGFQKVSIKPGASSTITVKLGKDAFSFYDDTKKAWVLEPGKFSILVGSSSKDIRLTGEVNW